MRGTEVVIADSQYGSVLFGPEQQAIYLFDKESLGCKRAATEPAPMRGRRC